MRVLVCGDRNWTDREVIAAYLTALKEEYPDVVLCHGAARGADTIAGEEARKIGIPVTEYPAEWKKFGKAAGPIRNRQMLKEFRPTHVYAFHDNIEASKGTKDMVNASREAGLCIVVQPHGPAMHVCDLQKN